MKYPLKARVYVYPGFAAWRFLAVDKKNSEVIKKKYKSAAKGFGSIKVVAQIGKTTWSTSIFPDKRSGTYLLPLKASVRRDEGIDDEDTVRFSITIV